MHHVASLNLPFEVEVSQIKLLQYYKNDLDITNMNLEAFVAELY